MLWDELRFAAGRPRGAWRSGRLKIAGPRNIPVSGARARGRRRLSRVEAAFLAEEAGRLRRDLADREARRGEDKAARRKNQG